MANCTLEQQRAIESQGRTIVSASAGSGKTTVMIEKIIRLIKDGAGVGEILAVTFTKKAAAQMKEKLCKELIEEINRDTTTPERRDLLKRQLSEVPGADISTIHSFCAKLLRSHFYVADVDSGFRVIGGDDAEGGVVKGEFVFSLFGHLACCTVLHERQFPVVAHKNFLQVVLLAARCKQQSECSESEKAHNVFKHGLSHNQK